MRSLRTRVLVLTALAMLLTPILGIRGSVSLADHLVSRGLIVPLRMNSSLSSRTARVGAPWTATVTQDVYDNGQLVIPRGTTVEGRVSTVDDADRFNGSGRIGIDFDSMIFPDGARVEGIDAMLTSTDSSVRGYIDEESNVHGGKTSFKRNVYFIGGGAGAGAVVGALAGGGKGAGIGAGVGAVAGIIASAFSKGEEASIPAGTEFAMELLTPVNVPANFQQSRNGYYNNQQYDNDNSSYNGQYNNGQYNNYGTGVIQNTSISVARLSRADIIALQSALRREGYYRGTINGIMTTSTRQALADYQEDKDITSTGDIDLHTANLLGLSLSVFSENSNVASLDANGQPTYMGVGATHRFIIWRDGNLWHLRTTTAGQEHDFEGSIVANNGYIRSIERVNLEANDFSKLGLDRSRRTLNFDFTTTGSMDGIDFYSNADTLTFNLLMDGRVTPQNVYVGRDGANPVSVPFTLDNQ